MNIQTPPSPPGDGIDEGKRLVRLGGDRGLSLAERLTDRFQRLAWRTPIHRLALRGRYPLKLLAVADDPFMGDAARGNAMLQGMLSYRGETLNIAGLSLDRPGFSRPFAEYVHSFAWLRDLSTVAPRVTAAPIAESIMRQWLDAHAERVGDPAWRADQWGRRILFWVAHAPLILSSSDLIYRSRVLNTLARGSRHLERVVDKAPAGLPRIAGWSGMVASLLMIPGGDGRRAGAEAGLERALGASLFGDGGVVSRSPDAQAEAIMLLTMLRATYAARRLDAPGWLEQALVRMVAALIGLRHGDGSTGSWQGSAPMDADALDQIVAATGVRTRPLRQPRDWGYHSITAGTAALILDAAPPPVARVVEGGCASTLAFELSDGPNRIIVNCGGARGCHHSVADMLGEGLRTTAAHSTLVIADSNSTAIHADGTLGRGVGEIELTRQEGDGSSRIEASHDGYVRRFGFVHRRQLILSAEGRDLRGEDMLLPRGRKRRGDTPFAVRFHLAPGIEVAPTADGQGAFLRVPGGALWQFRARGAAMNVEDSVWIDPRGRPHATRQLVLSGETPPGGTSVTWVLHRSR
ncbi:heparinase II/III family protein [Sphingomonas sp. BGYR3]|uniref:heparinase II/III family protein n=1 Tax=Sphingomonas sp. BGYR3 TaxID=2975483 RepID=UPI0021A38405|nr:heparinase II/III family protein [Sphingomonas sp. BGYR3]MDG5488581.1 heparinase II/III family protein [Sphingomonas sp. BGYR3]